MPETLVCVGFKAVDEGLAADTHLMVDCAGLTNFVVSFTMKMSPRLLLKAGAGTL